MPDFGGNDQAAAYENAAQTQAAASTAAANASLQATRESNALLRDMYLTGRADLAPWRQTGQIALDIYSGLLGLPSMYSTELPQVPGQEYPESLTGTESTSASTGTSGGLTNTTMMQPGAYYLNPDGSWQPYSAKDTTYFSDEQGNLYPGSMVQSFKTNTITDILQGKPQGISYGYLSPNDTWISVQPTSKTPSTLSSAGTGTGGAGTGTQTQNQLLSKYNQATAAPSTRLNATDWIKQTPGYEFQFNEGVNALDRSAASRGMLLSGAQGRAMTEYGQNFALGQYENYMGKLANLAGIGQTSATQTGAMGQNYATQSGQNTMMGAQSAAQANMAAANAIGSGYVNAAQANQGGGLGGMLGGAIGGAAMGYGYGGWPGAAIGGALGGLSRLFS